MCGIAGVIKKNGAPVEREFISRMNQKMAHRGPDAEGIFQEDCVGLGHRRLSIVGISESGNQPMFSHDRKYVIVFNGEIYNYCELKGELIREGAHFENETDTEVILEAYRYWGTACVKRFNGMWSFALYDTEQQQVFFSRDRFGVKPLYILDTEEKLVFASEIKCITEVCPEQRLVDVTQVARHMAGIQEDSDEHTFYENIKNFPKRHSMVFDLRTNTLKYEKYWDIDVPAFRQKWKTLNPYKTFRELLEDAIKIRLRTEVPVGASLSGGLDSSTIVGIVNKKYGIKMHTFSSIYEDAYCNEKEFIDCMNEYADTNAHYIYPGEEEDLLEDLKALMYYHDGPCYAASPYSGYCVYRGVGDTVKVLLDGQGADELFGGYIFFFDDKIRELLASKTMWAKALARKTVHDFCRIWPKQVGVLKKDVLVGALGERGYKEFLKSNPPKYVTETKLLTEQFSKIDIQHFVQANATVEGILDKHLNLNLDYKMLPRILHDVDRNSMARSLEVRLPFLDYRLVEFSYTLSSRYKIRNSWTKYIMRRSCKRYMPPKIYLRKNKMGFPAPFERWLRDERYQGRIKEYLDAFKGRNIVEADALDYYYKEHMEWKTNHSGLLFRIMMLEMWLEAEIDRPDEKWCFQGCQEEK